MQSQSTRTMWKYSVEKFSVVCDLLLFIQSITSLSNQSVHSFIHWTIKQSINKSGERSRNIGDTYGIGPCFKWREFPFDDCSVSRLNLTFWIQTLKDRMRIVLLFRTKRQQTTDNIKDKGRQKKDNRLLTVFCSHDLNSIDTGGHIVRWSPKSHDPSSPTSELWEGNI